MAQDQPDENKAPFDAFSKCLVKSESLNQWCMGLVRHYDAQSSTVFVRYCAKQTVEVERKVKEENSDEIKIIKVEELQFLMRKNEFELPKHNHLIKEFNENNLSIVESPKTTMCICGKSLDKLTTAIRQSLENVSCTVCSDNINDNMGFYCGNGKTDVHDEGFYICLDCVMERMGFVLNNGTILNNLIVALFHQSRAVRIALFWPFFGRQKVDLLETHFVVVAHFCKFTSFFKFSFLSTIHMTTLFIGNGITTNFV